MTNLRTIWLLAILVIAAACASGTPLTAPTASAPAPSGPITTPAQAWAAVVAFEPRFAGVTPLDPDRIGASAWYEIQPASGVGAFVVRVTMGWGDCEAGCIDKHIWTLAVAPDGLVTKISEEGPAVPGEVPPSAATVTTGVRIQAAAGPVCPVEQIPPDPACAARPVVGATISIRDASGASVGGGVTGLLGTLDIALPPGDYTIEAGPVEGLMGAPSPTSVTVTDGTLSSVDLPYDTGIR